MQDSKSWNHQTLYSVGLEGSFKDIWPNPLVIFHRVRLLKASSNLLLNISNDRSSITLGTLCQCLIGKTFFLRLHLMIFLVVGVSCGLINLSFQLGIAIKQPQLFH